MICNKNSQGKTTYTTPCVESEDAGQHRGTCQWGQSRGARDVFGREFQWDKNKPRFFFTGMSLYSIAGLSIKIWESLLACHDILFFVMLSPLQVWISFKFIGYWRLNIDEKLAAVAISQQHALEMGPERCSACAMLWSLKKPPVTGEPSCHPWSNVWVFGDFPMEQTTGLGGRRWSHNRRDQRKHRIAAQAEAKAELKVGDVV